MKSSQQELHIFEILILTKNNDIKNKNFYYSLANDGRNDNDEHVLKNFGGSIHDASIESFVTLNYQGNLNYCSGNDNAVEILMNEDEYKSFGVIGKRVQGKGDQFRVITNDLNKLNKLDPIPLLLKYKNNNLNKNKCTNVYKRTNEVNDIPNMNNDNLNEVLEWLTYLEFNERQIKDTKSNNEYHLNTFKGYLNSSNLTSIIDDNKEDIVLIKSMLLNNDSNNDFNLIIKNNKNELEFLNVKNKNIKTNQKSFNICNR